MSEKRNGKTIGIFVDEEAYARYAVLGLTARKRALAAAKAALLDALGGEADRPVVKESFTTEAVPAPVETPVVEKPAVPVPASDEPEGTPAVAMEPGTGADPSLAGFLDAGW